MKTTFLIAVQGIAASLAAPLNSRADYEVHSSHFVPQGWERVEKAHPDEAITLRLALKQGSFEELERQLYEVSDPHGAKYGEHLSMSDVHALTAPASDTLNAVHEWLAEHGITADRLSYSGAKDWIHINLPVSKIEQLLDTEYYKFRHADGHEVLRTTEYSLPKTLHKHIDVVAPTNYFGNPKHFSTGVKVVGDAVDMKSVTAAAAAAPAGCVENAVTLSCVRQLYKTNDYTPQVPTKNYVGITNYLNQTPSDTDFREFMTTMRPDASPTYIYSRQIIANAANDQTMPGVEADLDVEAVGGFVYPTRFTSYSTGGSPPYTPDRNTPTDTNEPYLTWLDYVLAQKDVPYTISTSYGDDEQTVPKNYATRVCSELAQLGAKGVTLLFSAGDSGVGTNGSCYSNDGKNTPEFLPAFPASCPYVTTVGGTQGFNPERVAYDSLNGYVPGGGFSNYFSRPSYQNAAVSSYLASIGSSHKGLYNASGRAYPDIAAQSVGFLVANMGVFQPVDGTSVASPISAGVLTLVNDALIAKGKKPLGFLNPRLYSTKGAGFTDIVNGRVTGCNTDGFPAQKGWDAASGWGTPDFKAIRASLGV